MSVIPSQLPSAGGKNTVGIFGRRVSTDALLLAGASVLAIILLYRAGRPAAASGALPVLSGDGSTLAAPLPSNAMISSSPAAPTPLPTIGSSFAGQPPGLPGLEVWDNPVSGRALQGLIAWGSPFTPTGPPVFGHSTPGGSSLWEPVRQGNVSGFIPVEAIGNIPAQAA